MMHLPECPVFIHKGEPHFDHPRWGYPCRCREIMAQALERS